MAYNLQLVISALAIGSVYALVALGFVLLVNTANILNFAQGDFAMLGAFVIYSLAATGVISFLPAVLITMVVAVVIGVVFERLVYRPVKATDFAPYVAVTLAASIFIQSLGQKIWGPFPFSFTEPFGGKMIALGGVRIRPQDVLIVMTTLILMVALYYFFGHTRTGKKLRATSQDKATARLLGINVKNMASLTFVMASVLGAIAGILVAPIYFVSLDMGFSMGLKAFAATIIGGWGSIPGAIVGGLLVAAAETFGSVYISSVYKEVFAFVLLIAFLIVRPQGIFGEKIADKA